MTDHFARLHLDSMLKAAKDAERFVLGMSEADFIADDRTQAAVAMCLIIIGEAANKIAQTDPDFVTSHPDWPWIEMRGMRNRITHDYERLELPIVWRTVKNSLPGLVAAISSVRQID